MMSKRECHWFWIAYWGMDLGNIFVRESWFWIFGLKESIILIENKSWGVISHHFGSSKYLFKKLIQIHSYSQKLPLPCSPSYTPAYKNPISCHSFHSKVFIEDRNGVTWECLGASHNHKTYKNYYASCHTQGCVELLILFYTCVQTHNISIVRSLLCLNICSFIVYFFMQ